MHHSYTGHCSREKIEISCRSQSHDGEPKPYAILTIGDAVFFPSEKQLQELHGVIEQYLEPIMAVSPFATADCEPEEFASGG